MLDHTTRIGSTPTFLYLDLNMNARLQTEIVAEVELDSLDS